MINFMTRRPNPLRYHTFNPGHAMFLERDDYFTNLKTVFPDHILLVDVDSSILGPQYFGKDYAQDIHQWIRDNYSLDQQFGETPFTGNGFGIQILKRNADRTISPNS